MAAAPARSTACIESKNHQKSLTNCAKALIGAMKTHQSVKVYDEYLTDIKKHHRATDRIPELKDS